MRQTFNYGAVKSMAIRKGYFSPLWIFPVGFLGFEFALPFVKALLWPFVVYWILMMGESIRLAVKTKNINALVLPSVMFMFHNLISFGFIAGLLFGKRAYR